MSRSSMSLGRFVRLLSLGLLALGLTACGGGGTGVPSGGALLTADSRGVFGGGNGGGPLGGPAASAAPEAPASDAAGEIAREIEEADLYRVEGDLLFLLNPYRGFTIVDLAQERITGRVPFVGFPDEMYVLAGRALVLVHGFDGGGDLLDLDISDPDSPTLRASIPIASWLNTSRLVGNVLYVVAGDRVLSFSIGASVAPVGSLTLPFASTFVHTTDSMLFVAGMGDFLETKIAFVDISNPGGALALAGQTSLPGYVSDEFKMHYGAGTFRVVTHDWSNGALSHLYMLDVSNPAAALVVGSLDLARGEQLFATRFTDEEAFVVTFERVDPLWVIDLRDPALPKVAGELTVPGWSTHIVPVGRQLVALGLDPDLGWRTTVSLFDVANPAAPALLSRVDFGDGWSSAFGDVKAFGVFPADKLVLVPFSGAKDRLAVVDLGATALTVRGFIDAHGGVQRGFPHARGICALTSEELVIADAATLAAKATVTLAENVVDGARLPDGRLLTLVSRGGEALIGGATIPLSPECMHVSGSKAAIVGWDDTGRAAYVADFTVDPPAISARFDLGQGGGGWTPGPWGLGAPVADIYFYFGPTQSILTAGGRLYVRGVPSGASDVTIGTGTALDGFTVIDVPGARRLAGITFRDAVVTGFSDLGDNLAVTYAKNAGNDRFGRPLLWHDLTTIDPAARTFTSPRNVAGYLVAARGDLVYTVSENWLQDYSWSSTLIASRTSGTDIVETSRLALPEGIYDLRAAGSMLFFNRNDGGFYLPMPYDPSVPFVSGGGMGMGATGGPGVMVGEASPGMPDFNPLPWTSEIGTVRLAATLAFGPTIRHEDSFASLLLPQEGAALVLRDGIAVERWILSGATATLDWESTTGAYPVNARPDTIPNRYLVALGYAGLTTLP